MIAVSMWPMFLDMSRDDSKRVLRRLELEAYSSLISAFRAQGDLTKDKKKLLQDLQHILSISTERHRAEVRRAVNDEQLATIADNMGGANATSEWLIEGRRLVPLMPRLVPQTAFTVTANHAANIQAEKNLAMPPPSQTFTKEVCIATTAVTPTTSSSSNKLTRQSSGSSDVVVLPSGMSIHIKGGLNTDDEEEPSQVRRRRRSQSTETIVSPSASTQTPRVTYTTTAPSSVSGISPMKITISKSPQIRTQTSTSTSHQKVILVSSSDQPHSSILQRTMSVPVVKTTVSASTPVTMTSVPSQTKASVLYPTSTPPPVTSSVGSVITVTTTSVLTTSSAASSTLTSPGNVTTTFVSPTVTVNRPRTKFIQRHKSPQPGQKPGVVIPVGPHPVHPTPQSAQNVQIKQSTKPTIQIKQEGGMKIITQNLQPGASKILPKPSQLSTSGTPVVVVSAGNSGTSTTSVTMVTRPVSSISATQSGSKILHITPSGKIVTPSSKTSNIVTVNPKTLHLTALKTAGSTGAKPNVIVVQKPQSKTSTNSAGNKSTTVITSSPFEKELVSFIQKQDSTRSSSSTSGASSTNATPKLIERTVVVSAPGTIEKQVTGHTVLKAKSDTSDGSKTSSLLAELIQAAGINADGTIVDSNVIEAIPIGDDSDVQTITSVANALAQSRGVAASQVLPTNEWFEYDVSNDQTQQYTSTESRDSTAIHALLEMQSAATTNADATKDTTPQKQSSIELGHLTEQLTQQQFYTIEQAMKILGQGDRSEAEALSLLQAEGLEVQTDLKSTEAVSSVPTIRTIKVSKLTQNSSPNPEVLQGELDPQTGVFYSLAANNQKSGAAPCRISLKEANTGLAKSYDLLSSSLAQAQIDLDPYQFIEDIENYQQKDGAQPRTAAAVQMVSVLSDSRVSQLGQKKSTDSVDTGTSQDTDLQIISSTDLAQPSSSTDKATENQAISLIPAPAVSKSSHTMISLIPQQAKVESQPLPDSTTETLTVTVEPCGIDTSHMNVEDFTSQQIDDKVTYPQQVIEESADLTVIDDNVVYITTGTDEGSSSLSEIALPETTSQMMKITNPKRKRISLEDSPTSSGSWSKLAASLLQKTSRFRGVNREKGAMNAAEWFTQPVDPKDAPDYYAIVQNPMDFGTVRRKLETNQYKEFEDFNTDMLLIRDNCYLYNPVGSLVRKDCDEVFEHYLQEYDKMKNTVSTDPLVLKKQRLDKSPGKS